MQFVNVVRANRLPMTGGLVIAKAMQLRLKHGISPDDIKVSKGWLHNFLWRHNFSRSVCVYGEAESVDLEAVDAEM